jgi:hypothetical protein
MSRYSNSNQQMYNSRYEENYQVNPFDKKIWGPKLWEVMHTFSFSYPPNPSNIEKQAAFNFYTSLAPLIPCKTCSQHCLEYVRTHPPTLNSKDNLIDWVFNFHNEVNKRLGKRMYTKRELFERYENVAFCNS